MDLGSPTLVINALEELPLVRVAGGHGHGGGVNRMTGRGSIYTVRPEEKAESYYGYGRGNNSGGDKARAPVVHRDGGSRRP